MTSSTPPRCLLIAPLTFYTFHERLQAGLEAQGFVVDMVNEEFPANTLGKILANTMLPLIRRTTLVALRRYLAKKPRYDVVLIVKGRGMGAASIALLKAHADRVVAYTWDSFDYSPSPLDWKDATDKFATFDIVDSERHGLPLVHLFSGVTSTQQSDSPAYDLSVVMRVHSQRLHYVDRALRSLKGRPVFVFLYAGSLFTYIPHALRAPLAAWRLRRHISHKALGYEQAMDAIANSKATLDYAHPLQSGITVRCFEALSMGVPVITNNPHAARAGVFGDGDVVIFPLDGDPGRLPDLIAGLARGDTRQTIRTMDEFIADLLDDSSATRTKAR
ncbi:glycosyltransferase family protein [Actibacterium sp. D379-3]